MKWKNIARFNGKYSISDTGLVKNNLTNKILTSHPHKSGYIILTLRPTGRNGKCYSIKIHREVALAFIPNPLNKPQVNHIDGIKSNNIASNLEWVTNKENSDHAIANGLLVPLKGTDKTTAKLTNDIVNYVRLVYIPRHKTFGCRQLAQLFGISHSTMSRVIAGKEWAHV